MVVKLYHVVSDLSLVEGNTPSSSFAEEFVEEEGLIGVDEEFAQRQRQLSKCAHEVSRLFRQVAKHETFISEVSRKTTKGFLKILIVSQLFSRLPRFGMLMYARLSEKGKRRFLQVAPC